MGRFFNDHEALEAHCERAQANMEAGTPWTTEPGEKGFAAKLIVTLGARIVGHANFIGERVLSLIDPMEGRLAAMEAKLATLETRGLQYRGTFQRADSYRRGDATTFKGSIWVCVREGGQEAPGQGDAWQLAVKGTQ